MSRTRKPAPVDLGKFPPPPATLPKALQSAWDAHVRAFPADHWRAPDLPLLVEMLRANAMADGLAERIAATTDVDDLGKLLKLRDAEVRRAATLATKLRLAPQSRSDRHVAERLARANGVRPWEIDPSERFFKHERK